MQQQRRKPRGVVAVAVAALFGLCLCVTTISLLLPHESARILRGGSPVPVLGDEPSPPTFTRLPTATIAPTKTPPPSPLDTPTPTSPPYTTPTPVLFSADLPADAAAVELSNVVDGDTIVVVSGGLTETVRYIGIDTPERGQPGYKAATDANQALLGAGVLFLLTDTSERDSRGRLLRYVFTDDGTMVNREMVAQGWAQPVEYRPDTQFADEFLLAARQASVEKRGFWSGTASDDAMPYAVTTAGTDIRSGPGAGLEISASVPEGTPLTVYGSTPAGDWLQVRTPDLSKGWIASDAVWLNVSASKIPIAGDIPATPAAPTAADGAVQIVQLNGAAQDETVVIQNLGGELVELSGWSIQSYGGGSCQPMADQVYAFPAGLRLAAGASVYVHSGSGALSESPGHLAWSHDNIWNNSGDRADLTDAGGQVVSTWAYGACQ